ncbi:TonB-dependent receptor [Massilia sp. BJB1822]|uniref:TonB-dependent receptor n=1 Tax=Massilia sp. BJB1822 TaxID=2744470 RepID=UPI0015939CF2|nr:TonB-dependent receptor [Massilia sp. BJB1822]NVD99310.1 TonB-dependent receptor [Massilia sp. BJB1822]
MRDLHPHPISRSLRRAFPLAAPLMLAVLAHDAMAQAAPAQQPITRVEITGTHIRRAQAETASPVQTVTRADIEKTGKSTVAELLQTLAVDNQGSVPTTFSSGFAQGASGISLRGLGTSSTLVLLNGRRIAPYGLADDGQKVFADLNIIPAEAVERVEILKDGASAVYGSDAIAGVVNVILRRDFKGTTVRASQGLSQERDGGDTRLAITHGFGDLDSDRYNALFSLEFGKKRKVWYRDRDGRGAVGRSDLRYLGFAGDDIGGAGWITSDLGTGNPAINGNVAHPDTGEFYNRGNLKGDGFTRTFPGAACGNFTKHPQGDPGGGCVIDSAQLYSQMQPEQKTANLFGRLTVQLNPDTQAYAELNYYKSKSNSSGAPGSVSGSTGYPGGVSRNGGISLGTNHPDNPYFGLGPGRLRYIPADIGPTRSRIDSDFVRALVGVKTTVQGWDIDSALLYSRSKVTNDRDGFLQRDVAFALLNPTPANVAAAMRNPAYAALPANTYWRIAENAGLNSAALYAALSPTISSDAKTSIAQVDLRASREFGQLPGGAMGLALGAEFRKEETRLVPTTGTERGNIIGLGYSAYDGDRKSSSLFAELLAPVLPTVELSAALRFDHFDKGIGNSYTPKAGLKWTPTRELAFRATLARGFRAPNAAENGRGGLSAFSSGVDTVRCALGVDGACNEATMPIITSPNSGLSPERSKSYTVGMVWDPLPRTSLSVDLWQIKRTNEINQETTASAIAANRLVRDPTGAVRSIPGDPGPIVGVLTQYVNSAATTVRGVDVDVRKTFVLPNEWGNLTADAKWTHLFQWRRVERDGTVLDFAGTHGNCDVSNCMGTPDNRANFGLSWDRGAWRIAGTVNYRGAFDNKKEKSLSECASHYADGREAPGGCKIKSFATLDLTARWKFDSKTEIFGTIQNLFDKEPPLDPLTYGAQSYNPSDYSGALGRYFSVGARYTF